GELQPDTAAISYAPESGIPTNVERLQATCNLAGDSLGLAGFTLEGPVVARYLVTIAPFRGDGEYRSDSSQAQIGGSVAITGQLQLFISPPYETIADIARDGALGRLKFSG